MTEKMKAVRSLLWRIGIIHRQKSDTIFFEGAENMAASARVVRFAGPVVADKAVTLPISIAPELRVCYPKNRQARILGGYKNIVVDLRECASRRLTAMVHEKIKKSGAVSSLIRHQVLTQEEVGSLEYSRFVARLFRPAMTKERIPDHASWVQLLVEVEKEFTETMKKKISCRELRYAMLWTGMRNLREARNYGVHFVQMFLDPSTGAVDPDRVRGQPDALEIVQAASDFLPDKAQAPAESIVMTELHGHYAVFSALAAQLVDEFRVAGGTTTVTTPQVQQPASQTKPRE